MSKFPNFPRIGGPGHLGRLAKSDDMEFNEDDVSLFLQGEMVLFVESSNVEYAKYYPNDETLEVGFLAKPPDNKPSAYLVLDVSVQEALTFANAESKGRWYWSNVRIRGTKDGHKKTYVRLR